jgi:hypothetical protein
VPAQARAGPQAVARQAQNQDGPAGKAYGSSLIIMGGKRDALDRLRRGRAGHGALPRVAPECKAALGVACGLSTARWQAHARLIPDKMVSPLLLDQAMQFTAH